MAKMDYESSNFKNSAIDRMSKGFGKGEPEPKPHADGPVNLMGVQNALNKGISRVKSFGEKVSNAKINNPVKTQKREGYARDNQGNVIGKTDTKTRQGLSGDRSITTSKTKLNSGATSYSRTATNPKGGKMVEITKDKSYKGDAVTRVTRFDKEGDVMKIRSFSKTGKN